jgi:hypothetical protein
MTHLDKKTFDELFNKKLVGRPFLNALAHLEVCETCRKNIPHISPSEIINKLETNEMLAISQVSTNDNSQKVLSFLPRFVWAFASLILVFAIGYTFYTFFKTDRIQTEIISQNKDIKDAPNQNLSSTSTPPQISNSIENEQIDFPPKSEDENTSSATSILKNSQPKLERKHRAKSRIVPIIEKQSSLPLNTSLKTIKDTYSEEEVSLNKFLIKIPSKLAQIRPLGFVVRGKNSQNPQTISPNSEVILTEIPNFTWSKVKDAEAYEISITDRQYREFDRKITTETNYKSQKKLERGKIYLWKINAKNPSDNEKSINQTAIFKVADNQTINKLNKLRKRNNDIKTLNFMLNEGLLSEAEAFITQMNINKSQKKLIEKVKLRIRHLRN